MCRLGGLEDPPQVDRVPQKVHTVRQMSDLYVAYPTVPMAIALATSSFRVDRMWLYGNVRYYYTSSILYCRWAGGYKHGHDCSRVHLSLHASSDFVHYGTKTSTTATTKTDGHMLPVSQTMHSAPRKSNYRTTPPNTKAPGITRLRRYSDKNITLVFRKEGKHHQQYVHMLHTALINKYNSTVQLVT